MDKFLLLSCLILIAVGVVARKFLSDRPLRQIQGRSATCNGGAFARLLLEKVGLAHWAVREGKKRAIDVSDKALVLKKELLISQKLEDLVIVARAVILAMVGERDGDLLTWRVRWLKISWLAAPFLLIVLIFAVVVMKVTMVWALVLWLGSLVVWTLFGLSGVWLEFQGALMVSKVLREQSVLGRREDTAAMGRALRALPFRFLAPPMIELVWPVPIQKRKFIEMLVEVKNA